MKRTADDIWEELHREANEWTRETGLQLTQYVLSCEDYETLCGDIEGRILRFHVRNKDDGHIYVWLNGQGRTKLIPWP